MRALLTLAFLVQMINMSFAQSNTSWNQKMSETDSLYLIALEKYIEKIETYDSIYSLEKTRKLIHIEYQDYLRNIPDTISGYALQRIGIGNRKKVFKEYRNNLRYVVVRPLSIDGGNFYISVTPFFAELKRKRNLHLSISNWFRIYYRFKNSRLIYDKTESGGI